VDLLPVLAHSDGVEVLDTSGSTMSFGDGTVLTKQ
jgi:hypothetical protein